MTQIVSVLLFLALIGFASSSDQDRRRRGDDESSESKKTGDPSRRVSEMLDSNNLPQGLFPLQLVSDFSMEEEDGSFAMRLERSCYAKMEEEMLWYGEKISGKVRPGRIEDLSGVQARELLVWLAVKGLHVDDPESGYVYLEIGMTYSRLKVESFHEAPPCSDEVPFALGLVV